MTRDYIVAIPTHRRAATFAQETLAYLCKTNVSLRRVVLYLSDAQDVDAYAQVREKYGLQAVLCQGARSATDKFNAIHYSAPAGSRVFVLEDDVQLIEPARYGANGARVLTDLEGLLQCGFSAIAEGGIFGIAPHANTFFMQGKQTSTLKLIVAHAFGFIATGADDLAVRQPSKTDYERTCKYWQRYGRVVRLDVAGPKTRSYTRVGGMQADHTRDARAAIERAACEALVREFPLLLAHKEKRSSPFAELRFLPQQRGRSPC